MYNFNGINGSFIIIDLFTLNKTVSANLGFKLFYFFNEIIKSFNHLFKVY